MTKVPAPHGSFGEKVKHQDRQKLQKKRILIIAVVAVLRLLGIAALGSMPKKVSSSSMEIIWEETEIPEYQGKQYYVLNGNIPFFTPEEYGDEVFETYSELDSLGRCGTAFANICKELMPTEARGEIGQIKPSGWNQAKYPGIVDSEPPYLYNRCHLIGFQLAGENANEKNLITGTRYFNVEGMLPFENSVREYIDETDNHVLYRVTPVYDGENLVANGVIMEAWSIEDNGQGVAFNVFVYNVQPGITINYADGSSSLDE
jgi:DNA-entry nuclease